MVVERPRQKYFAKIEKRFVLLAFIAIWLALFFAANWAWSVGQPGLTALLIVIALILIPITIFVIDMVHWEGE
jgi:membrane protein YdbS with pleckstrin-like domain